MTIIRFSLLWLALVGVGGLSNRIYWALKKKA
jgi:hypothetical protein